MSNANKPCSALASALHEADPAAIDALLAFIRSAITDSVAEQLNTLWNLEKYDPDSDDPVDRVPWLFENDAMSASDFSLTEVMGSLPAASKSTPPSTASKLVWAQMAAIFPSVRASRMRPSGVASVMDLAGWKMTGWWMSES